MAKSPIFTTRHYEFLARSIGNAFAACGDFEVTRTAVYDSFYTPLVKSLAEDNERFDMTRFAYAVATAEREAREAQ